MAAWTGVTTSQDIPRNPRGKIFLMPETLAPVCFHDRWGMWHCGHDHNDEPSVPLQDAYQYFQGWTSQDTI